ncbi:PEP-CTERM sorting domain-containing protein [Silvimonas iriomotensis]|uniref:Ice-binding protein C-terminal domain-containing protein n=1 Tax=Silvimonas iriomotensis TaxID=449662 RepID=A0ABQ2PCJ9_9NEIS|nr:PEP-CTERM sorting domain-containing protein [Silvimonas iriomotensis]GGP22860.1 hypothetical protein GCM10010970_28600 [Silvimonas iriomotensis]
MKMRTWCGGLLALLLSSMAHATLFDVSYSVTRGDQTLLAFSGYLTGELSGNLVTNVSDIHLTSSLWPVLDSYGGIGCCSLKKPVVFSLDGTENSFVLQNSAGTSDLVWWPQTLMSGQSAALVFGFNTLTNRVVSGGFFPPQGSSANAVWSMNAVSAVPEPESWLLLAGGLGVISLVVRKRTRSRPIELVAA